MQMFRKRTIHIGMGDDEREARRDSIGGSDARIIMSGDQDAIEALWAEKRGEKQSEDLSGVLIVAMGNITEALNLDWFEKEHGLYVTDEQLKVHHPDWDKAHSTLDGYVRQTPDGEPIGIMEAKFMLPFNWSIEKAIEKYHPQLQHNMMVTKTSRCWLSVITGGGQYVSAEVEADVFYQIALLEAEKDFWDCVQTGRTPGVPIVDVPLIERIKVVDMSQSNEWGDYAAQLVETKPFFDKHEKAKKAIKKLFPQDAKEAAGFGVKIALSKDGKQMITIDKAKIEEAQERLGIQSEPAPKAKKKAA